MVDPCTGASTWRYFKQGPDGGLEPEPESMLRAKIRSREVGCPEPTTHSHRAQGALLRRQHEHVPGCGAWRVTEPVAELACEMGIVAKARGVGDFAQGLVSSQ